MVVALAYERRTTDNVSIPIMSSSGGHGVVLPRWRQPQRRRLIDVSSDPSRGHPTRVHTSCSQQCSSHDLRVCMKTQRCGCDMAGSRLCCLPSGRRGGTQGVVSRSYEYDVLPRSERLLHLQPDCSSVLKLARKGTAAGVRLRVFLGTYSHCLDVFLSRNLFL